MHEGKPLRTASPGSHLLHDRIAFVWSIIPFYTTLIGKNEPYIHIPAGFRGPDGVKQGGENSLGFRAFGS
jgi:hypothetical protein